MLRLWQKRISHTDGPQMGRGDVEEEEEGRLPS